MRLRWGLLAAVAAVLALLIAGCGGSSSDGDASGSTKPIVVKITQQNGSISADHDLVEASTGQKIIFKVTTDADDEIHVHSEPEHEFEIHPGGEQTFSFSVDTPGTVEVESHGLDMTILKLEVR